MIPLRLVLENFLSFGSPPTEICFGDDEPLWVLSGANGVGKSAVFDAMTYALYGEHRGGKQDHVALIRHGANGFRVVFEFRFHHNTYRITRNRSLTGRPGQSIELLVQDAWQIVTVPPGKDSIRAWSEQTLGLGYDAFVASVLLKQGEAEKLIGATGANRLDILKKLLGAARYEALSTRVHQQAKRCKDRLQDLVDQRGNLPPVTEAEVQAAQAALTQTEAERTAAHQQVFAVNERLTLARQWARLDAQRQKLVELLHAAADRAAAAERIRAEKQRLDVLTEALPLLRQFLSVRQQWHVLEQRCTELRTTLDQTVAERAALRAAVEQARQKAEAHRGRAEQCDRAVEQLRSALSNDQKLLSLAEEVARLQTELADFPIDLAAQQQRANALYQAASAAAVRAGETRATAAALLRVAQQQLEKFGSLAVGSKCSLCGQPISARHAAEEHGRLIGEVRRYEGEFHTTEAAERAAMAARDQTQAAYDQIDAQLRQCVRLTDLLSARQQSLSQLGLTVAAPELQRLLADKTTRLNEQERQRDSDRDSQAAAEQEARRLDAAHQQTGDQHNSLLERLQSGEQALAVQRGRQEELTGRLSACWQALLPELDDAMLQQLAVEQHALEHHGVRVRFRLLEQDEAQRQAWEQQLEETSREIDLIAADARVPTAAVEVQVRTAQAAAASADRARDAAKAAADQVSRLDAEHTRLKSAIHAAERQCALHQRLDKLLGKEGLQRELVRTAERDIIRLANDTVRNLSDGDLSLELDGEADGDKAFTLRVRHADSPEPIAVDYLSGSQRFRVAVATALAIGRFSSSHDRPLESVIIDEGFGSLDRDGLHAAAVELNRLREHLKRIIVVSHQEEFVQHFPAVIQLTPGEHGTTARAVRR